MLYEEIMFMKRVEIEATINNSQILPQHINVWHFSMLLNERTNTLNLICADGDTLCFWSDFPSFSIQNEGTMNV